MSLRIKAIIEQEKKRINANDTNATRVENSTGCLIICYISFRTVNFPCFLPYSFPVLHVIE
jgi:hypothetical protein